MDGVSKPKNKKKYASLRLVSQKAPRRFGALNRSQKPGSTGFGIELMLDGSFLVLKRRDATLREIGQPAISLAHLAAPWQGPPAA